MAAMARKAMMRLNFQDMADLRRCCEHIAAIDNSLHSSSWQAAPAFRIILKSVYEILAGLYNRAEPIYLELLNPPPTARGARITAQGGSVRNDVSVFKKDQAEPQEE